MLFSRNGSILPMEEAVIPLRNVEYSYGFSAYETVRVFHRKPLFLEDHIGRLLESARIIGLVHPFSRGDVTPWTSKLIRELPDEVFNLKILLIGARDPAQCQLILLPLSPVFPEKKSYTQGVNVITFPHERMFPHAKILNMFPSYYAYKKAFTEGGYDALLLNRRGCITEGTRTNFFAIKGAVITSPPAEEILEGVMRKHVLAVAEKNGFQVRSRDIPLTDIATYDGAFITSTSTKILPVSRIDDTELAVPEELRRLMKGECALG